MTFVGEPHDGKRMNVITRLDDYGNINADLTEVTVVTKGKNTKSPPPRPLTEVVEAVAQHQAAGFSPSTEDNIQFPGEKSRPGTGKIEENTGNGAGNTGNTAETDGRKTNRVRSARLVLDPMLRGSYLRLVVMSRGPVLELL